MIKLREERKGGQAMMRIQDLLFITIGLFLAGGAIQEEVKIRCQMRRRKKKPCGISGEL